MSGIRYTLIGEGTSDRLLKYPIKWALGELGVRVEQSLWADLRHATQRPKGLAEKIRTALKNYPAELLFVHRDADREPPQVRHDEIRDAMTGLGLRHVAIVPVRMSEAWFLHDEQAIRRTSGNPNGTASLGLPPVTKLESLADPKAVLEQALLDASETSGRRRERKKREIPAMRDRGAELTNFAPLISVPAFRTFMDELRRALVELGRLDTRP